MQLYVRSNSVVSRVIAGETLIVPVRGGVGELASIYSLNAVGSTIWDSIERPRTRAEIQERIEHEFNCEGAQTESDINFFLADLQSAGLVSVSEASE